MKTKIQSSKKNRNMTSKNESNEYNESKKTVQPAVLKLTNLVTDLLSSVLGEDELKSVRDVMFENKNKLQKIMSSTLTKQSITLKKVKDPDAPKRAKTSYIFFCIKKRDEIMKENPNMSAKEIIKELGIVWRDLPDNKKAPFVKLAEKDKERYEMEMKNYEPPDLGFVETKKKKAKRNGPKRSLTAYIFFCKEHRDTLKNENPNWTTKEITSGLGKRWKELSDKEKEPFVKLAEEDHSRYEKEKESWNENTSETEVTTKDKTTKDKTTKDKTTKDKNKDVRKKSGYILFCQEERAALKEDNPDLTNQQITKELGKAWKELSEDEQNEYNQRANE